MIREWGRGRHTQMFIAHRPQLRGRFFVVVASKIQINLFHPPYFYYFKPRDFFPNTRISYMQDKPLQYFVIRSPYAQSVLTGVKTFEFRSNAKIFANKQFEI
jgi:hypothetical protein